MAKFKKIIFNRKEKNKETKKDDTKETEEKMVQATKKEAEILFQTKTVFPFDFFPDKIILYTTRIDIIEKEFFFSRNITTMSVKDIATIEVQTSPFFATIRILPAPPFLEIKTINYLKVADAIKLKKIVDKLLLAIKHDVDLLQLDVKNFLAEIK